MMAGHLSSSSPVQTGLWGEIEPPVSMVVCGKPGSNTKDSSDEQINDRLNDMDNDKESYTPESDDMDTVVGNIENECQDHRADFPLTPLDSMLHFLASTDAHFRHQQRGEPDLSHSEKVKIASDLFQDKPSVFLSRFGTLIRGTDIICFSKLAGDYVVDFHLKEIKQRLSCRQNQTKIRNRRYEALKKLESQGNYFSDEEMKERDPLLYERMVGQYLTEEEVSAQIDKTNLSFSNILLTHIQVQQNNELYKQQQEKENCVEDESDEEYENEDMEDDKDLEEADRLLMRQEFVEIMQQRFLSGEDKEFDYKSVDDNAEYDSLDIIGADEEERYFDEQEENMAGSISSSGSLQNACVAKANDDTVDYMYYEPEYESSCGNEAELNVSECIKGLTFKQNTNPDERT